MRCSIVKNPICRRACRLSTIECLYRHTIEMFLTSKLNRRTPFSNEGHAVNCHNNTCTDQYLDYITYTLTVLSRAQSWKWHWAPKFDNDILHHSNDCKRTIKRPRFKKFPSSSYFKNIVSNTARKHQLASFISKVSPQFQLPTIVSNIWECHPLPLGIRNVTI